MAGWQATEIRQVRAKKKRWVICSFVLYKNTECPPPQTPQTRCCFRKTLGYSLAALRTPPFTPSFFCFSLSLYFILSANQLSRPIVAAQITAACQQYPGIHSISSLLETLSLRPNYKCKVRESEICLDGDHLIQSAREVGAYRTARPMGNPVQCMAGWGRQRHRGVLKEGEARQLAQGHTVLTPEFEPRGSLWQTSAWIPSRPYGDPGHKAFVAPISLIIGNSLLSASMAFSWFQWADSSSC